MMDDGADEPEFQNTGEMEDFHTSGIEEPVNMDKAGQIAEYLLSIKAFSFRFDPPFTWASGLKAPVYCDNRLTLAHPIIRTEILRHLSECLITDWARTQAIAGVATAGIPYASLLAHQHQLPMLYVRSSPKGHGRENQVEGEMPPGTKVLVIEDLISTGKSAIEAAVALRQLGHEVVGVQSLFSYGFPQTEGRFADAELPMGSLCDLDALLSVVRPRHYLPIEQIQHILQWQGNPDEWRPKGPADGGKSKKS